MKYAKGIGLLVAAALAVMALVGASTAAAKVCSKQGTGEACASGHGNKLAEGAEIHLSITTPNVVKLTSGFITVTCGESTILGHVTTNPNTGAMTGKITVLTFKDCHSNLNTTQNSCTASTSASTTNPWNVTATTGTAPNGNMEVTSEVTGTFTCNAGIFGTPTCRYRAKSVGSKGELKITGGEPAKVDAESVPLEKEEVSSGSCSATATWEGTYTVDTPSSLYMT